MSTTDPRNDFTFEEQALLDAYVLPPPSKDWADALVSAARLERQAQQPRLRQRPGLRRRALFSAALVSATGLVTAAAAERGAFGPAIQQQVQAAMASTLGRQVDPRPAAIPPGKPPARSMSASAPSATGAAPQATSVPDPDGIAPVIEKLRANPAIQKRLDRFLARESERQVKRGETPTPPDITDMARRYRQLSPERKRALRQRLRSLPREQQAEIRAIIREYRASRRRGEVTSKLAEPQASEPKR